jgi:hypothetical protein
MSEELIRINDALRQFSTFIGSPPLALDEHGVCAFTYEQTMEVVLELPPGSSNLYLHATVMPAPTRDQTAFYERLLHWNAYCLRTRGATLALDPDEAHVLLCYLCPVDVIDQALLGNILTNFVATLKMLIGELSEAHEPQEAAPARPESGGVHPSELAENWQYLANRV